MFCLLKLSTTLHLLNSHPSSHFKILLPQTCLLDTFHALFFQFGQTEGSLLKD